MQLLLLVGRDAREIPSALPYRPAPVCAADEQRPRLTNYALLPSSDALLRPQLQEKYGAWREGVEASPYCSTINSRTHVD